MSDVLHDLPLINGQSRAEDYARLYPYVEEEPQSFFIQKKRYIITSVIFLILSLNIVTDLLVKLIPFLGKSSLLLVLFKTILFGLIFFALDSFIYRR